MDNETLLADAIYLFIHGDEIDEYHGWTKQGKAWVYINE